MDSFSADTRLSSSHPSRHSAWLPVLRPAMGRAVPSCSRHTHSDAFDPLSIAPCAEPDYPHVNFAQIHAIQRAPTHFNLLYHDVYSSPPTSPPASKSAVPLPEDAGVVTPLYSTHLAGVLDSPPVLRREDLALQKPLTPPPTMLHSTQNLPDVDADISVYDPEVEDIEEVCETDESHSCPSPPLSPHIAQSAIPLPLSPLSPTWDTPCTQALSVPSSPDFQEHEHNALFSRGASVPPDFCHPSPLSPHEPLSLLGVDADTDADVPPLLTPISLPWTSSQPMEPDPEPPSPSTSGSPSSLIDYDGLSPPSSPVISRRHLPDLEDDGFPKVVPSSPSRRSFKHLPDSDVEMGGVPSDSMSSLTGRQLLSLPGADTDDDLLPPVTTVPLTPGQPLLFIDDPRDIPLPRSPSPEFDLCLSPDDIKDPELLDIFGLWKRSKERDAKRLEALVKDNDLFTRADARKLQICKREQRQSKELSALMRLMLGDGASICPQEQQSPECDAQRQARRRGAIRNVTQLVAQTALRRNDTSRPLAKRKTANVPRKYARSPLAECCHST